MLFRSKWPIVFAGLLLDDADMRMPTKSWPSARFQEDDQTAMLPVTFQDKILETTWNGAKVYFVGHTIQSDGGKRGQWEDGKGPIDLVNPKDWPRPGAKSLASEGYRTSNTSSAWVAQALAMRLMHAEPHWAHDAFFAYVDRWMTEDDTKLVQLQKENGRRDITTKKFGEWPRQGSVSGRGALWVAELWKQHRNNIPVGKDGAKTPPAEATWK